MREKIDKKRIGSMCSIVVFVLGILAVAFYIVCKEKVEYDSDFTDTILWANAMLTGNGLFDKTMNYAYTLPFGGSMLMAPFVALFGISYKAHALGMLVFMGLFVLAMFYMFKGMGFSVNERMTASGIVMLLSLASKSTRMIMWGHVIHYSLGVLFVMAAIAIFSKINLDKIKGIPLLVLAVLCALFCTNGLTTILFFAIPFFGAIIVERFVDTDSEILCKDNINTLIVIAICGACGMVGFVISKVLQRGVITVYEDMFKQIPMWQNWIWDITERLRIFVVCLTGEIMNDVPMDSVSGIKILLMAVVGMALILIPFIALVSYKKFENRNIRVYLISYFILLFASMFVFDFSMARGTAWRVVGLYMSAVITTAVYMVWLARNVKLQRFAVVIMLVLSIGCLLSVYNVLNLKEQNRYEKLGQFLSENGLEHGYAEYWSSYVVDVLSDSKVTVLPIKVEESGEVSQFHYNCRGYEFEGKEGTEKYFTFLSKWEYDTVSDTIGKDAIDVLQFDEDGYVLVFDENIF